MTLHDRIKEIIDQHDNQLQRWDKGNAEYPTPDTIAAIIAAVMERLPGVEQESIKTDRLYSNGWNAYRQEVLKALAGEQGK